ncbi:MAG TPA: hypothetical protein VMW24_19625 [Sedimentisphaerales bacterium]|nr:hypothetical protein [Sedimentisphaerales bacterium]
MITQFKNNSYRWSPLPAIMIIILACISLPDAERMKASETSTAEAAPGPMLRRIEVKGRGSVHSRPSFDGKYMSDVDRKTGNLVVRELVTGKERMLTTESDPNRFAYESRISPDNKKVAFLKFDPAVKDFDLRLIGFDGSDLRTLLDSGHIAGYFNIDAWSPDGRYIFGRLEREPMELVRISSNDGSLQVIKTFDQGTASKVDISPDGRYLAYSRTVNETSNPDIFVFDLERQEESPLVTAPSADKLLGWTPDGQSIFFASDRNGTWDGWLLPVVDGKPRGLPEMVKAGMGDVSPIGFTQAGAFYYGFGHEAWNVYTVMLELGADKVLSEPSPVRDVGKDGCPDWSPDGQYLAYCSQPDSSKPQIIRIQTLATGEEREIQPGLPHFDWLRWCPDSRHLLITSFNWGEPSVVYRLDIQTGEHTALVQIDKQRIRGAELSADGKTLAYRIRGSGNSNWLIVRDLETGREKEVLQTGATAAITLSPFNAGWALSPDGKHLALSVREGETNKPLKPLVLKIISIVSGQARTIAGPSICEMTWTSDGHDLVFVRHGNELWRVSAEGGEPQKLWEWERKQALWGPRIHPDAQRLAFYSGGYVSEMWVMENFLPTTAVAKSEPMTTVRKIGGDWGTFASLSPDGRYMCDVDWDTENLAVLELATGKVRHLTSKSPDDACYPLDSAISPDSKEVAYLWWDPNTRASSLHVVGLDGSGDRLLCKGKYPMPRAWSADGKKILAVVSENDVHQMVWVSASDGSMQHIASFNGESLGYPGKFDISPDGRFVAFDRPGTEDASKRDLVVFDLDKNVETSLVEHPADDRLLGWTPDGRHVLFASDRAGNWDAWLLQVADGRPQGFPKLTKHGIGDVRPIGFTPYGSYYYAYGRMLNDVFTARLDLDTGEVMSEPVPIRQTGATACHDWSPDGQYLAYCERRPDESQVIHVRTLATGRERTLAENLPYIRWLRWSPDRRSLLIDGYKRGDSQGVIFKINVQTGKRTELVRSETEVLIRPEMSPDGKTLFFDRNDPKSKTMRLMARDLESGREKELLRIDPPARLTGSALSPDGRQLVLSIVPSPTSADGPVLRTISTAGGQPRELLHFEKSEKVLVVGVTWMPDSWDVLFWKSFPGGKEQELWRISAEGGEPRRLWSRKTLGHMRVHPDGQRVAFYDRSTPHGVWVMENFLPEDIGK